MQRGWRGRAILQDVPRSPGGSRLRLEHCLPMRLLHCRHSQGGRLADQQTLVVGAFLLLLYLVKLVFAVAHFPLHRPGISNQNPCVDLQAVMAIAVVQLRRSCVLLLSCCCMSPHRCLLWHQKPYIGSATTMGWVTHEAYTCCQIAMQHFVNLANLLTLL